MTKADKLKGSLEEGTISAPELRTLLKRSGAILDRTKGSHEVWKLGNRRMVLATHGKDLKEYQIRNAKEFLYGAQKTDG